MHGSHTSLAPESMPADWLDFSFVLSLPFTQVAAGASLRPAGVLDANISMSGSLIPASDMAGGPIEIVQGIIDTVASLAAIEASSLVADLGCRS